MLSQLQSHSDLILNIVKYEHRLKESVEQYKAVVELVDGSYLRINEVWLNGELKKYAYYWLTPTDTMIQGRDNAPHYPKTNTFPHHSHNQDEVEGSQIRSLADILDLLLRKISG